MQKDETPWAPFLVAGLPAASLLVAWLFTPAGPKGLFQADLVALVVAVGCAAFAVRGSWLWLAMLAIAAVDAGIMHALVSWSFSGAPAVALLVLGVGAAASGIATLGRVIGAPPLAAGTVAGGVLWVAMTGLFWADPLAETLPATRQHRFRQAVLHLDPATACAYDGAGFDRFHDPRVYRDVTLASSLIRAPAAVPTGSAWLALGLLAWGVAGLLGPERRRGPADEDTETHDRPD